MTSSTPSKFPGSIRVEQLSKSYPMKAGPGDTTLKFNEVMTHQLGRLFSPGKWGKSSGYFTALEEVSFEIQAGELVGLVGKNGSGKSTLLKLLAKVTKPTSGRAYLRGRVASLLEVGTGFHPELTGHENIYLCGTILGMSRAEVARNFEEIVAFSEVGPFLHIPIKRLSSGMAMRLAFSVAAHLAPDILLVDEALSVGDAAFQKKCIARMQEFVTSGATVIFVTHDLSLVNKWCKRVLLLDQGRLIEDGPALPVVEKYLRSAGPLSSLRVQLPPNPLLEKSGFTLGEVIVNSGEMVRHAQPFRVDISFRTLTVEKRLGFCLVLSSLDGSRLVTCESSVPGDSIPPGADREHSISLALRRLDLGPGSYLLDITFQREDGSVLDQRPGCLRLEVHASEDGGTHIGPGTHPAFDWTLTSV